ncbi:MAG: glutamine synthetase type III, partial [Christensenellaceae bacterium]|nr:glutamine synthetase type III [Christensenellaceae bacterium]
EPNIMLNTIVADVLMEFADRLEQAEDFTQALNALIRQTIRAHKRIIFGGNSYCPSWVAEAQRRGLADLRSAAEAIPRLTDARNVALFKRHAVFTEVELNSRKEIMLEHYVKVLSIEALTMLDMVSRDILPGIMNYSAKLGGDARVKQEIGVTNALDKALCEQLSELAAGVHRAAAELDERLHGADESQNAELLALYYRQSIFPAMAALRQAVDAAEPLVPTKLWPYPNYGNLLFSVS